MVLAARRGERASRHTTRVGDLQPAKSRLILRCVKVYVCVSVYACQAESTLSCTQDCHSKETC